MKHSFRPVTFEGECKNGVRIGLWLVYYETQIMYLIYIDICSGRCRYYEQGVKIGKW